MTKYCGNCGNKLNDDAEFCDECGASQKKSPRDSTKSYSPRTLTFSDVPQIAAYHKKF